jgi:hypothetical protein
MPLHPAEAAQLTALLELQVNVDEPPGAITEGKTERVAAGMMLTVTAAGALVPPGPEQVRP